MSKYDLSDLRNFHHVADSREAIDILKTEKMKKAKSQNPELKLSESSNVESLTVKSSNVKSSNVDDNFRRRKRGPIYLPCVVGQVDDKHFVLRYDYR